MQTHTPHTHIPWRKGLQQVKTHTKTRTQTWNLNTGLIFFLNPNPGLKTQFKTFFFFTNPNPDHTPFESPDFATLSRRVISKPLTFPWTPNTWLADPILWPSHFSRRHSLTFIEMDADGNLSAAVYDSPLESSGRLMHCPKEDISCICQIKPRPIKVQVVWIDQCKSNQMKTFRRSAALPFPGGTRRPTNRWKRYPRLFLNCNYREYLNSWTCCKQLRQAKLNLFPGIQTSRVLLWHRWLIAWTAIRSNDVSEQKNAAELLFHKYDKIYSNLWRWKPKVVRGKKKNQIRNQRVIQKFPQLQFACISDENILSRNCWNLLSEIGDFFFFSV